ncbi:Aspartate/tyrosine/aromatic aminotransferase [Trichoderma reesei QM6a]|uniref:Aspartate/tyrosine/aromatic aminotransferase n=2 Tax=Hypocrea jecorina TaxID=51453 RepID=G0RAB6_HYPJQ|nr:Aspartate/tyrosine/aromatic aminotransferase [Trichoderma reesei QM6a]EGR51831.1 Aspartate/tyrosine/aromatic aminotransferase [Trichoderma reesei QM6a]ETS05157.1 PLP-dependent transferase [Trichoderma reesei RUT C-30]
MSPSSPPSPPTKHTKQQINLLRGWPSPALLPAALLSSATQRILASPATSVPLLQYAPDEGYQPLRERLAEWLARHYGVEPDANRICVTGGASQNLACILQSFTDPGWTRAVWMVAPCYHLAGAIFEDAGFRGRLRAVPEDEEGVDVGELERRMEAWEREEEQKGGPFKDPGPFRKLYRHVIYAVPTCSNPSGKTMSLDRRQALVRIARKHDALIISDDVYDFLQWPLSSSGSPLTPERPPEMRLPRLCDVDMAMGRADNDPKGFGHAVSNGSFSKIAGPGVRTGWAEATPAFALGLSKTGSSMSGGAPSGLCAGMMADLLESGELVDFIETKTRPALQRRHRIMMDAVREHLEPLGVVARESSGTGEEGVYGGYFVWLTLTRGPTAVMVSDAALKEENVIVGRGNMFAVKGDEDGARFDENIRLCFSWEPEEDLVEGVKRLGELIGRMQGDTDHYERLAAQTKDSDRPVSSWV